MFKSKLQTVCQHRSWPLPEYTAVKVGPDHNPRFTSSVVVNGVRFEAPYECRSLKEAQNEAAKVAFDQFVGPEHVPYNSQNSPLSVPTLPQSSHISPSLPCSDSVMTAASLVPPALTSTSTSGHLLPTNPTPLGVSTSNASNDVIPVNGSTLQPANQENAQISPISESSLGFKDDKKSKDMIHIYKNRLQNYAQKRNLDLPVYSFEFVGLPHTRQYKSKLTFDGKNYESPQFFPTLKEAEHAAAKIAFESLSPNEAQEIEGLYKSLLQELAHKEGFLFPTYETIKSGPPHTPTFVSIVEVGGRNFRGQEGKTKKQAEMNAAKAAYICLNQSKADGNPAIDSSGCHEKETLEVPSSSPNPAVTEDVQLTTRSKVNLATHEGWDAENGDTYAKRHKISSSPDNTNTPQSSDPFPSEGVFVSSSKASEPSADGAEGMDTATPAKSATSASSNVLVIPRQPNMTLPKGFTVLPISDDKWVAMRKIDE